MLTTQQKKSILENINRIRRELKFKSNRTLEALCQFENNITLDELETAIHNDSDLTPFFHERWERIRKSTMSYTRQPFNPVNVFCLDIARILSPSDYYLLLMPSLTQVENAYGDNIHALKLHEFVLSDDESVPIPVVECLRQASISDGGVLKHLYCSRNEYPPLSPNEIARIKQHSLETSTTFTALEHLNNRRLLGNNFGAQLSQLVIGLRRGGAHYRGYGFRSGQEKDAGYQANQATAIYYSYWTSLPPSQQKALLHKFSGLEACHARMFRPQDVALSDDGTHCVEMVANQLDPIIDSYKNTPEISALETKFKSWLTELAHRLDTMQAPGQVLSDCNRPPRHILHRIHTLPEREQAAFFPGQPYGTTALMYALEHEPHDLPKFELTEKDREEAIKAWFPSGVSALKIAAKEGALEAVRLLVSFGANVTSTAIHDAITFGHEKVAAYLLDIGVNIEQEGAFRRTPLHVAALNGHGNIVELLLERGASLEPTDTLGNNPLDIAKDNHPSLLPTMLLHLAKKSPSIQKNCLRKFGVTNVLFFAAKHDTSAFETLLDAILSRINTARSEVDELLRAQSTAAETPLTLAAELGLVRCVEKIIQTNSVSTPNVYFNALLKAVQFGRTAVIECLLDKATPIYNKSFNVDPFQVALKYGKDEVLHVLFRKLPNKGDFDRDLLQKAIQQRPTAVPIILQHIATLPSEVQKNYLPRNANNTSVFTYVLMMYPELLPEILTTTSAHFFKPGQKDPIIDKKVGEFLRDIALHKKKMEKKSEKNIKYIAAIGEVNTLLLHCAGALDDYYRGQGPHYRRLSLFKYQCTKAIEGSKPILKQYRELYKAVLAFLVIIFTLPVSLPLYLLGCFSIKTQSEQLTDNFAKAVNAAQV